MHLNEDHILKDTVKQVIEQRLGDISAQKIDDFDNENAFFVGDLGELHRQHLKWKNLLPRIEPFYAIKCNPDPVAVRYLASLGIGFDCASKSEIEQVLNLGVDPSRIIYAQPCKQPSFLRYASQNNVALMTFDNEDELYKIKKIYPDAKLVLRMLVDDSKSDLKLGRKYGASASAISHLLHVAKELELNVVGVSFHVGSGCSDENAFYDAVVGARHVFDQGEAMGFDFTLLDVGGGFPEASVTRGGTFEKVAAVLGPAVDTMFPPSVRVIAEPGRYYVTTAYTLCTSIIGRRIILPDEDRDARNSTQMSNHDGDKQKLMYYINEGFYGSFLLPVLDPPAIHLRVLAKDDVYYYGSDIKGKGYQCSIWGPTCCPYDCVIPEHNLPLLNIGDWLYFENAGAYVAAGASNFNGFSKAKVIHTNTFNV
ncbi:pyridoxal-dependent decarboxylase [Fennellomyces sp. T-0311]|nr:pyridoxal-dependent decarboxylase [Fennellomyces sp. T-0311]